MPQGKQPDKAVEGRSPFGRVEKMGGLGVLSKDWASRTEKKVIRRQGVSEPNTEVLGISYKERYKRIVNPLGRNGISLEEKKFRPLS